jgi:ribonuclease BN (tRNA processing enzyme)
MFSVLDVGDGACSVLRHDEDVAIIDCGSNDLGADAACERLLTVLGGRPEVITTIIVTHFDTDHYAGFLKLAERMSTRGTRFANLRLIAPRPPEEQREYITQYFSLAMTVTGMRHLDLVRALENVTVNHRFSYVPASRNLYSPFLAAGVGFTVHWPPRKLRDRVAGEVRTAMRLYGELSRRLRAMDNNALYNNLRRAQHEWPRRRAYEANYVSEETELRQQRDDAIDLDYEEDEAISDSPEIEALNLPGEVEEQFAAAWDAFRRANNNMSIIFDDRSQHGLAVFGDAGKSVLRWLVGHRDLAPRYDVMLAPHHGTQRLPGNFDIRAELCISQNGSRRGDRWPQHLETHHNGSSCITTRLGSHNIHIWDR